MLLNAMLLLVLAICLATDLYNRKIYNKVIVPGLILAFGAHYLIGGWPALAGSAAGFAAGFGVLLIPYLLGGMGAGDVKLLALVGALKGVKFVLTASLYMALLGAVIAILILLFRKESRTLLRMAAISLCGLRYGIKISPAGFASRHALSAAYPYGTAIAGGAILSLLMQRLGVG